MKVDPKAQLAPVAVAATKQPFKQLLAEARSDLKKDPRPLAPPPAPPPIVKAATFANMQATTQGSLQARTQATRSIAQTAQTLTHARAQANTEAQRRGVMRSEALEVNHALTQVRAERAEVIEERGVARILDFIAKEFTPDTQTRTTFPEAPIASVHHLHPGAAQGATKLDATPPEAKAAQAVALIERIEVFVRSQRPGLALTLNNSLGASAEIERVGPKEIALKLVGHRGPPTAEAVSRIRDELHARGLKVVALSVA
jgi:hypothetical protein